MYLSEAQAVVQSEVGRRAASRGQPRFDVLLHLLDAHPRWGVGLPDRERIAELRVVRPPAPTLQARFDGGRRWYALSWRDGAERRRPNRARRSRSIRLLWAAMRNSVGYQARQWRRLHCRAVRPTCAQCRTDSGPFHVDHADPPFRHLAREFLRTWVGDVPHEFVGGRGTGRSRLPRSPFEAAWRRFHQAGATYQLLCQPCNLAKGARGQNSSGAVQASVDDGGSDCAGTNEL